MIPTPQELDTMAPVDPRPQVIDLDGEFVLAGWRCSRCHRARATPAPWCPVCRAALEPENFGPLGTVWSSTMVHLDLSGLEAPYGLAYVDLDQGPRVLVHVDDAGEPVAVGARVRLSSTTERGDPTAVLDEGEVAS